MAKKKAIMRKVLSCLVIIAILMSAAPISVLGMNANNSTSNVSNRLDETMVPFLTDTAEQKNNLICIAQTSTGKSSLTVNVYNINKRPLPPNDGRIKVKLMEAYPLSEKVGEEHVEFKARDPYASVTFYGVPPSDQGVYGIEYEISVWQEPDMKDGKKEYWGSQRGIFLKEGHNTIDFIRCTQWVSDIKINGKSPYTNEIIVDALDEVSVDITVRNSASCEKSTDVILTLDRDKESYYDFNKESHSTTIEQDGSYTFHFVSIPQKTGTYYFYILVRGEYFFPVYYVIVDQHEWYKAFTVMGEDTTPPETECTLSLPSPNGENGWYVSSVIVTLKSTDLESGIDWIDYGIDSDPGVRIFGSNVFFTVSNDGVHFITYSAMDKAGNKEDLKFSPFFFIDTTNPSASISTNNGAESTNSRSVTLYLSYSDATSGVKNCRYKNEGESWISWESCSSTKSWTLAAGEGTKKVYYQVRDNAGNTKEVYDTIVLNQKGSIYATSNPSGANVYLDGTYKGTSPITIPNVPVGSHTVKYTKSGYYDCSKAVTVNANPQTNVHCDLVVIPQKGSIYATSNPSGANVYLDGTYKGTSPITIPNVPVGSHTVKYTKASYEDCEKTVTVNANQQTNVHCDLVVIPQKGSIHATSNPSGANVYLDGTYKGTSPITIPNVPVGSHTVKYTKASYDDCEKTVTVNANQQTNVHCDLVVIPQKGSIHATSNPSGANVYLDGTYKGTSPITIPNVPVGSHTVKYTKASYEDCEKTVTVNADQQTNAHCDLVVIPQKGSIHATSNPSGANVYLDGTYKGTSPITIPNVPVGSHTVKYTKSGYTDCVKTVTVNADQKTNVHCDLVVIPQEGSIYATSNPSGANVYLDGTYKGTSPITIPNVPVGSRTVKYTKAGYTDCVKTVTVNADQKTNVHCDLVVIPQEGSIYATSNPSGANVYLDGTYKGTSPITIPNVPVGSRTVKYTKSGYTDCVKTVTVNADQKTNVHCDLQSITQNCKAQITYDSSLQDRPSIVYANGYYYVAYQSHEKGYGIFLKKLDSNWNLNKKVEVVSGSAYYDSPSLLFANNKLYVAYISNAKGANANDYDVIVKEYDPNSLSYTKGAKYLTSLHSCQDLPALYYKDGYFYMAYQSWEKGDGDIYIKKFDSNWNQLKKVQVTSESSLQDRPSITYADGYFYVAYFSKETGNYDIFVKRLNNNLNLASWKKQITSKSSSQSYPFITFVNNQFAISYASTESGTLGIYMKKYDSSWNYIEKTKVIDSSAYERRPSHTWDGRNFWVAYVYNYGDSKDWNIFAITPGCADVPSPTPSPTPSSSCCPTIEVTAGTEAYFPGDTVYITIALTGRNCCLQLRKPSPVSLIAPSGETIAQDDLASRFSGSICPGTHSKFGMSFKLPEDAPYEYYDVKVSLSGGECTKTVNDVFFVDWL